MDILISLCSTCIDVLKYHIVSHKDRQLFVNKIKFEKINWWKFKVIQWYSRSQNWDTKILFPICFYPFLSYDYSLPPTWLNLRPYHTSSALIPRKKLYNEWYLFGTFIEFHIKEKVKNLNDFLPEEVLSHPPTLASSPALCGKEENGWASKSYLLLYLDTFSKMAHILANKACLYKCKRIKMLPYYQVQWK